MEAGGVGAGDEGPLGCQPQGDVALARLVTPEDAVVFDGAATTSTSPGGAGSEPEAAGWVVVTESAAREATAVTEARGKRRLELLKKVWRLRVCQRKSFAKIVESMQGEDGAPSEAEAEAMAAQVEAVRNSVGLQWTWFEQELQAGRHDEQLLAGGSGGPPSPAAGPLGSPLLGSPLLGRRCGRGSKRSTPSQRPRAAPGALLAEVEREELHVAPWDLDAGFEPPPRAPEVRQRPAAPPPEVWMAAKEHRKTNFFAAAAFGGAAGGTAVPRWGVLLSVLRCVEVADALGLALASSAFAASLVGAAARAAAAGPEDCGGAPGLWRLLGARAAAAAGPLRTLLAGPAALPFQGEPGFCLAAWARSRAFAARLAAGTARAASVVPAQREIGGFSTTIGPFLSGGGDQPVPGLVPDRLLVCDGRQTWHTVDVLRRNVEEAHADRFRTRLLRSSAGAHEDALTASWPVEDPARRVCVAGGVLVARPAAKRGREPADAAALQWLQLPGFDGAAGAAGAPLRRVDVSQERLAAVCGFPRQAGVVPEVDALWPLPGGRVLLLVREAGAARSPAAGTPARSPATGPLRSPAGGPRASPTARPGRSPPSAAHGAPGSLQAPPLAALELPGLAREASVDSDDPPARASKAAPPPAEPGRWWLQAWSVPEDDAGGAPRLERLTSSPLTTRVTAVAADDAGEGLLLLGLASGGAELWRLPPPGASGAAGERLAAWPAAEEGGGPALGVLLRRGGGGEAQVVAVVAQARCLVAHSQGAAAPSRKLLPAEDLDRNLALREGERLEASLLRPVGRGSFAVCTSAGRVYAFEARPAGGPDEHGGAAALASVVELPLGDPVDGRLPASSVRSFEATLYEFFVVLDEALEPGPGGSALCGPWPRAGDAAEAEPEEEEDLQGPADDEPPLGRRRGGARRARPVRSWPWRGWARGAGGAFEAARGGALSLSDAVLGEHGSPALGEISLHQGSSGEGGRGRRSCGSGLLAVVAPGPGVAVSWWGVEACPELERLREQQRQAAAEEERARELVRLQLKLQRAKKKLEDMDKLQQRVARARERGEDEALTAEELAKLARRKEVEAECDRLSRELGFDDHDGAEASGASEEAEPAQERPEHGGDGAPAAAAAAVDAARRRREKDKQQKGFSESKRALQKERRTNRDRKGSGFDD